MYGNSLIIVGLYCVVSTLAYKKPHPLKIEKLYTEVNVTECRPESFKEMETIALTGSLMFYIDRYDIINKADCTFRITLPKGNRVALWVEELQLPVQNEDISCSKGEVMIVDSLSGTILNPSTRLCGSIEEEVSTAYLTDGRSADVNIVIPYASNLLGDIAIEVNFVAFKTVTNTSKDKSCYICRKKNGNQENLLCIDNRLKCDSVQNCVGEYENEEDFAVTRDETCTFVCNSTDPVNNDTVILDGVDVCNVFEDCPNGEDEDAVLCARDEIFGPFGLAGGIIIILCIILLVVVITLGLYSRRKVLTKKTKRKDVTKYSKGESPSRGDAV
ncbi:uncharacterized protein LOC144362080 [Saccoglossus kowalevskii]